ncbi:MAG: thiolase family protein [Anaerolineae bacterium]|nr:thiolase family protein [Anaerolineae bacterium]
MFKNVYVPYKGYWCSPFCRWQGSLQNENATELAAVAAKRFLELRGITPDVFDGIVYGATIPQRQWFFDAPYLATLMGNPNISGPRVSQACATSTVCLNYAASFVEVGSNTTILVVTADRTSNCPNILWPNPSGPGGKPHFESWMMDGFNWDPVAETSPLGTADNVARKHGITREESDALVLNRYNKYLDALAEDRKFQKGYMLPLEVRLSRKETIIVEEDEGIIPCTPEGLAKLKPAAPDSILTFAAQTHPADGNAGMIVTTKERADELSADKSVTIQILSYGFARAEKAHMPEAPIPAAMRALEKAGIAVTDLAAVKTHNPFSVNDIVMRKELGIDDKIFNNYGCSLIWGHPQGPTTMRLAIELIEELVLKGGGYGLVAGCAAGDSGAALVIEVS